MAKEYIYYCKTCGKIESRDVVWATLQQSVDMSFCPNCKVQINRILIDKDKVPTPDKGVFKGVAKIDAFNKYGGRYR